MSYLFTALSQPGDLCPLGFYNISDLETCRLGARTLRKRFAPRYERIDIPVFFGDREIGQRGVKDVEKMDHSFLACF